MTPTHKKTHPPKKIDATMPKKIDVTMLPIDAPATCRARYTKDSALLSYACYQGGDEEKGGGKKQVCIAILELAQESEWGCYRHGIAGEEYKGGIIQPIGPFAGSERPKRTNESYIAWVRRHLDMIAAIGRTDI